MCSCVGRRGVEPRHPAVSARCRHRLAHAPCCCVGWSRECSNLPLPGFNRSLRHQSFETMSCARLRCTWSRRRGSNPLLLAYEASVLAIRTSPARCGCGVAGGIRTLIPGVAHRDPRRWTTTTRLLVLRCRGVATLRWTPGRDSHPRVTGCNRAPRSSATGRCCQGGARTPAFRVTAGRLAARLPGTGFLVRLDGCCCN